MDASPEGGLYYISPIPTTDSVTASAKPPAVGSGLVYLRPVTSNGEQSFNVVLESARVEGTIRKS